MRTRPTLSMVLVAMLFFAPFLKAQTIKNIFVLHMEGDRLPANQLASKAIQEVLGHDSHYQIFEEYMDENRLGLNNQELLERLQRKYASQKMNLVLTVGPQALAFMEQYGDQLWPSVPVVFSVLDYRTFPNTFPENVTGVRGSFELSKTIDLILRLQPDVRQIFYVGGAAPSETGFRRLEQSQDLKRFAGKIDIEFLDNLPFPQLLERLGQLPDRSAVIYFSYFRDITGQPFIPAHMCPAIVDSANAPVYGGFKNLVGCGIVGGVTFDVEDSARQAASIGLRILRGENIANLPVEQGTPNKAVLDWRQLKKWNIQESNLPSGAEVLYREPSPWERYRKILLSLAIVFVILTGLVVLLVVETIGWRRSEQTVSRLTTRLIHSNEEERRRIARELHDDIGQRLSLLSIQLTTSFDRLPEGSTRGREDLSDSVRDVDTLITDVHNLSHQLHSSKLELLGLAAALKDLCQQLSTRHELLIEFKTHQPPVPLPQDFSLCLYRVAQEALNNVIKHSNTDRVEVTLGEKRGRVSLLVRDFGVGFKPGEACYGLGLATMKERLRIIHGRLTITSKLSEGTLVAAEVAMSRHRGALQLIVFREDAPES